jgi:hypothetical protein
MVERSRLYLFHVVEELELRGMPTELALLPYIESAFNPQAVSSAKAAGMWQFMPGTGRDFHLKQNVLRDERRSVLDSTRAALDYLQMLHDMFGDWHLALAAYNWGQGNVSKAIERNKAAGLPTGYLDLNMPAETRNYVPKLQAVKNIIANPTLFGAVLPDIGNHPFFDTVDITRDIDVEMAARLAEVRLEDFKALNPSQRKPIILPPAPPDPAALGQRRHLQEEPGRRRPCHAGLVDGLGGTQHHGHARGGPAGEHGRGRAARTQRRAARHADPARLHPGGARNGKTRPPWRPRWWTTRTWRWRPRSSCAAPRCARAAATPLPWWPRATTCRPPRWPDGTRPMPAPP